MYFIFYSIKNLKSIKNSPKDTLCYYNVTSKSKITKSIQFNLTSSELVLITQSTNGMRYTVKPSVGTAIQTFGRFLADSSAQVYSIYNADYFTVTYTTTSDVSTGLSSQEVGSTDETIWKYPVPAIIPIILSLVIILFIIVFFFLCCIWICRCIKNKKQNEGNSKSKFPPKIIDDSQPLVNKEDDMIELEDSEAQE